MILLSGDVVPFNKQRKRKIKGYKVFFFQDPATVDERKLLLLLLRPLCEVLTWLHLLSALSCQTDDKGRTIFTLGVLFGNKTTKKRKELCKTAKSTLYNMLIGGKKKVATVGYLVCVKKCDNLAVRRTRGVSSLPAFWPLGDIPNFLTADHGCAETFLSLGEAQEIAALLCVSVKWSENQTLC